MDTAKLCESLKKLFARDLEKLQKEIESYRDEASMWVVDREIKNSGGNLCLHLIGNLKTYIGTGLGNKPYQRDRVFEFSGRLLPVDQCGDDFRGGGSLGCRPGGY